MTAYVDAEFCDRCGYYGHDAFDCRGFGSECDECGDFVYYDEDCSCYWDEDDLVDEDQYLDSYWEDRLTSLYE